MDVLQGITPHFGSYNVRSLGWPAGDRSVIVPFSFQGVPFPAGVHRDTVPLWNALLTELTGRFGVRLMNPGCWGYNYRPIRGGGSVSFHAAGLALDVNAPENPYSQRPRPHSLPDGVGALARSLGMEWGGDWKSPKDYMHFEIHLTPDQVRTVATRVSEVDDMVPVLKEGDGQRGGGERGRLHWWVLSLQALLNVRGLSRQVPVTGEFGPETTEMVKELQARAGLPVDGRATADTWRWALGNDAPDFA